MGKNKYYCKIDGIIYNLKNKCPPTIFLNFHTFYGSLPEILSMLYPRRGDIYGLVGGISYTGSNCIFIG